VPEISNDPILDELKAMRQRMDSLFHESFEERDDECLEMEPQADVGAWHPPVDIFENDKEWMMLADLPGILEQDVTVEIVDSRLLISGERKTFRPGNNLRISQMERSEGRFSRAFLLPANIHKEEINAELKQGVLKITVPKSTLAESPRKVTVKAG